MGLSILTYKHNSLLSQCNFKSFSGMQHPTDVLRNFIEEVCDRGMTAT